VTRQSNKLRYSDFWERINIDAFEEAIGFVPDPDLQRGDNDVGYCIWPDNHSHGDTTGKFAIHREKKQYNCYVCGGGSLLSLAMLVKGLDVDEATEWLYQFTEEDMRSDTEFTQDFLAAFEDVQKRTETLPYFNTRVLDQHDEAVADAMEWCEECGQYEPWMERRRVTDPVVEAYGIRYNSALHRPAPKKGRFENDPEYIGPGLIFPHVWKGRLVGWQTRWLEKEEDRPEWLPKYTMTTDFPKETTIYGLDQAKDSPFVFVVESVTSVLPVRAYDIPIVATFGSNVNPAQMRILRRWPSIVLCPDNDIPRRPDATPAGIKWMNSLGEYLKQYSHVYHLPPYGEKPSGDLGDVASQGPDTFYPFIEQMQEWGLDW
jgi:hypothetical protein